MRLPMLLLMAIGTMSAQSGCSQVKSKPASPKAVVRPCNEGDRDPYHFVRGVSDWGIQDGPAVCAGGKWIPDVAEQAKRDKEQAEAVQKYKKAEAHKKALWDALRTRPITDEEMAEVLKLGTDLIPNAVPTDPCDGMNPCTYMQDEWDKRQYAARQAAEIELQNALLNQFKMRLAEKPAPTK